MGNSIVVPHIVKRVRIIAYTISRHIPLAVARFVEEELLSNLWFVDDILRSGRKAGSG